MTAEPPSDHDPDTPADAPLVPDLDVGGLAGGEGELDLGNFLGMAMDMQALMAAAQDQANRTVVEGQAGGGVVRIEVTGGLVFQKVEIDPAAVDPDDVEMLQDLVLAALHDAVARVNELAEAMNPMANLDLANLDMGGMDLGGLFGLPGGDDDADDDDDDDDDDDAPAGAAG